MLYTPLFVRIYSVNTPLQKRLVTLVVLVAFSAMLISFTVVYLLMQEILYQRADEQLEEGLDTWVGRGMWLPAYGAPSDFYQALQFPGYDDLVNPTPTTTPPDFQQIKSYDKAQTIDSTPGSEFNRQWRAMVRKEPNGTVRMVAKKLDSERRMLTGLALTESVIGVLATLGIIAVGRRQVHRALQPLREVERTALAIADGDQNRRVPAWSRETEVGKLSYAVNTMVTQLQESLEDAKNKEEQMRRFVGDASHELRTPLTSVRGYAELYRRGMATDADMVLGKIEEESARMQLLVEDLLALTRAEGARLEKKQVDAFEVVCSAASTARAAFPDRVMQVDNKCTRDAIIEGDPDRLHQALLNLITNVFRHAGEKAKATITVRDNLDMLIIEVADDGVGMTQEDAAHIFDRFYRADTSRNRASGGGSGLGLSITKSIVEQHDGTVTVQTAPGEGSTFTISLPLPS